jgi:hypothetical protein
MACIMVDARHLYWAVHFGLVPACPQIICRCDPRCDCHTPTCRGCSGFATRPWSVDTTKRGNAGLCNTCSLGLVSLTRFCLSFLHSTLSIRQGLRGDCIRQYEAKEQSEVASRTNEAVSASLFRVQSWQEITPSSLQPRRSLREWKRRSEQAFSRSLNAF